MANKIETVTSYHINGTPVESIGTNHLAQIFEKSGYTDCGFEIVDFLKLNQDGHALFKVLSFDKYEREYILGYAIVSEESADFPGVPEAVFSEEEFDQALAAYKLIK